MTSPATDNYNIIVGQNLHEFLCLACQFGFMNLELLGLASDHDRADYLINKKGSMSKEEYQLLDILRREFHLTPWHNIKQRLAELDALYQPLLILNPF